MKLAQHYNLSKVASEICVVSIFSYDPKAEKDARIIFKRRSDGLEESVDVGAPGTEVNQMIDALEEVPVSRTKQVRQIGRRIARKA